MTQKVLSFAEYQAGPSSRLWRFESAWGHLFWLAPSVVRVVA